MTHVVLPLAALLSASAASAQQTDHDAIDERQIREREVQQSQRSPRALIDNIVLQRPRPAYDAAGINLGGFRLYPKIAVQLVYDNNIFETPDAQADEEAIIQPSLSVRSDWERHSLGIDMSTSIERFARHPSENLEKYNATLNGVLDLGRAGHVHGLGQIVRDDEGRGTIGDLFPGGAPIRYLRKQISGEIEEHLPGVTMTLDGDFARYRYDNVHYLGVLFPQAYRNRDEAGATGQAAFRIAPQLALFTELSANDVRYDEQVPASDFSSHGQSILAGVTFQVPALLSGEIGIGYLRQTYDELPLRPVEGLSYDLSIIWNATPLLATTLSAYRAIQQTPYPQAPSIIESHVSAQLDYELLRNVLLKIKATVTFNDFGQKYPIDTRYSGTLSTVYLINRTMSVNIALEWRDQQAASSFLRAYRGASVKAGLTAQH